MQPRKHLQAARCKDVILPQPGIPEESLTDDLFRSGRKDIALVEPDRAHRAGHGERYVEFEEVRRQLLTQFGSFLPLWRDRRLLVYERLLDLASPRSPPQMSASWS